MSFVRGVIVALRAAQTRPTRPHNRPRAKAAPACHIRVSGGPLRSPRSASPHFSASLTTLFGFGG